MTVRLACPDDLEQIMDIFAYARCFMQEQGNPGQWINGYPSAGLMQQEIAAGHCHVCVDDAGSVEGTFCLIAGDDPTYARIEEGSWLDDAPYSTLHRLASGGRVRGVADACLQWCVARCPNLRADTHRDNRVMQHILEKYGFRHCGTIYVQNGTARMAYQRLEQAHS